MGVELKVLHVKFRKFDTCKPKNHDLRKDIRDV